MWGGWGWNCCYQFASLSGFFHMVEFFLWSIGEFCNFFLFDMYKSLIVLTKGKNGHRAENSERQIFLFFFFNLFSPFFISKILFSSNRLNFTIFSQSTVEFHRLFFFLATVSLANFIFFFFPSHVWLINFIIFFNMTDWQISYFIIFFFSPQPIGKFCDTFLCQMTKFE